jgi:hypothetical protein
MRSLSIVSLLLIAALLLTGCGPAVPTAADETTASGQRFLLSLPRLEIEVDEQGNPTVGGVALADIGGLLGVQLPEFTINPYYVDWMTNTNVQHIELVHGADGIYLYVNGQPMPYIGWDSEALANVGQVAGMFNMPFAQLIGTLVPVLERTGLNLVMRFPTQEGAETIALRDPNEVPAPPAPDGDVTSIVTHADVTFDKSGIPSIAGISGQDLANIGIPIPALAPATMDMIKQYGINDFKIATSDQGIDLSVNGMPLPHIVWNNAFLNNAAGLYAQMNPDSPYIELAKLFLPELNNVDVDLMLKFAGE